MRWLRGTLFCTAWLLAGLAAAQLPGRESPPSRAVDARGMPLPGLAPRLGKVKLKHENMIISAVFAPDGKTVATGGWDKVLRLWEVATGKELRRFTGHQGAVYSVAFSPDGSLLVSGGQDKSVRLWETATGKQRRLLQGHEGGVTRICFLPDGKRLASASYDQTIRFWNVETGKQLLDLNRNAKGFASFAISPDGKLLACSHDDWSIRLLDAGTGAEVRRFKAHDAAIVGLTFSPDSRLLATTSEDHSVRLWTVRSGKEFRRLQGHANGAWVAAFSPDGRILATGGRDPSIRLWEISTGSQIRHAVEHKDGVPALEFSPDGRGLLSASHDFTALIWDWSDTAPSQAAGDLAALWTDLGDADGIRGRQALSRLAAAPDRAVPLLARRLQPVPSVDPQRIERLLTDLNDQRFAQRQKATAELQRLGELAEPALQELLRTRQPLEVRQRAERLLTQLDVAVWTTEQLRAIRAIEALERIGSAEARQVLEGLARGAPAARLTNEARAALRRLPPRG
jgi:hypothetical protein